MVKMASALSDGSASSSSARGSKAPRSAAALLEIEFEQVKRNFALKYDIMESELLGEGTFGKVYKAFSNERQHVVAIKNIQLTQEEDEGIPSRILREIAVLQELNSEYVVKLFDHCCSPSEVKLVFEFVDYDLRQYMKSLGRPMAPRALMYVTWQVMKGLGVCHARSVIHRDIKPQNVLIDSQLRVKLADFGLARRFSVPMPKFTHEVVTLWYRAPEILLGSAVYGLGVDLWSVGCIFAEVATGRPLFSGDSEICMIFEIFKKLGTPTNDIWPNLGNLPDFKQSFPKWPAKSWDKIRNMRALVGEDGVDLLNKLMVYDPKKRMSARGSLSHGYFKEASNSGSQGP
jgi:cyclin-dependent kinase